jgi:hypothetical protein
MGNKKWEWYVENFSKHFIGYQKLISWRRGGGGVQLDESNRGEKVKNT